MKMKLYIFLSAGRPDRICPEFRKTVRRQDPAGLSFIGMRSQLPSNRVGAASPKLLLKSPLPFGITTCMPTFQDWLIPKLLVMTPKTLTSKQWAASQLLIGTRTLPCFSD
jgi:hypothetical protein